MLDTVLTTDCGAHAQKFQLALGIDLPHAINLGFSWAATGLLESAPMPLEIPSNVRVISVATLTSAEEGVRLRLLESYGQESMMKLTFIHQISQVRWNGEVHESQAVKGGLVIDGKTIECVLRRYELVDLEIVFSENYHP